MSMGIRVIPRIFAGLSRQALLLGMTGFPLIFSACSGSLGEDSSALDPLEVFHYNVSRVSLAKYFGSELCTQDRQMLLEQAWVDGLRKCASCHLPGGRAGREGATFKVYPDAYPKFAQLNLKSIYEFRADTNGVPYFLAKGSGQVGHGGGNVIDQADATYSALFELGTTMGDPESCEPLVPDMNTRLHRESNMSTLRRASLLVLGELPDSEEIENVRNGDEKVLSEAIAKLLKREEFLDVIQRWFNDLLLTDKYIRGSRGVNEIQSGFRSSQSIVESFDSEKRNAVSAMVAKEPLDLITYIIKNDRPLSEMFTADYAVLNPVAESYYNRSFFIDESGERYDYSIRQLVQDQDGRIVSYPHAGILSSPFFLNRYQTSNTNRNRSRARVIYLKFLATDILKVADRPIDPTAATGFDNPTMDNPDCTTCHAILDPLAGGFQHYHDSDYEKYIAEKGWYDDVFDTGFAGITYDRSSNLSPLQWMGQQIAEDPRFAMAVVQFTYRFVFGEEKLFFPEDRSSADYEDRVRAWQLQHAIFDSLSERFKLSGFNFRSLVREMLLSDLFRVSAAKLGAQVDPWLTGFGASALITPEALDAKIEAITGVAWTDDPKRDERRYLMRSDRYRLSFGGIDSDNTTTRIRNINPIMAKIVERMANEVACRAVSYDFSKDMQNRLLFPFVELTTDLSNEESSNNVKKNIRYLFDHVLGESYLIDDPEVETMFELFELTQSEGAQAVQSESEEGRLSWQCQYRHDPGSEEDVSDDDRIYEDEKYIVRSWMAVVSAMLGDYSFVH